MIKQLGSMPFSESYLSEENIGHWVIENDPGKEPRMYADKVMLGLIGVEEEISPEENFKAWLAGIDSDYMDSVMETERLNVSGIRAEVQYPWHYPDGRTILIRCEGIRNYDYKDGIRTEGRHKNVTGIVHLQKEVAVMESLSSDYECVSYLILRDNGLDGDSLLTFRISGKMKTLIPGWKSEPSFLKKAEMVWQHVYSEDAQKFFDRTQKDALIKRFSHGESVYRLNTRFVIDGEPEYYQLKFTADRDPEGKLVGLVIGVRSIDDEKKQELKAKERAQNLVDEKTKELQKANKSLSKVNNRIIEMVCDIVESRDEESGNHSNRVKYFTRNLALQVMKDLPEYNLTIQQVLTIADLSPLHDIGKIKIPDSILRKPGKLTPEEFEIMKTHCDKGCEVLDRLTEGLPSDFTKTGYEICKYHHEKWDGKGYPRGIKGDDIPISAQIVSIADIYDALVSERCYKQAYTHEEACRMINNGECGKFSDKLLECFNKCSKVFESIAVQIVGNEVEVAKEGAAIEASRPEDKYIAEFIPVVESISESMPGGFFICQADQEQKLVYFNQSMVEYLGCSTKDEFRQFTQNSFKGIVHVADYKKVIDEVIEKLENGTIDRVSCKARRKDGITHWLDLYGKTVDTDDMGKLCFVFAVDETTLS